MTLVQNLENTAYLNPQDPTCPPRPACSLTFKEYSCFCDGSLTETIQGRVPLHFIPHNAHSKTMAYLGNTSDLATILCSPNLTLHFERTSQHELQI